MLFRSAAVLMGLVACSHAEQWENIKPKPSERKEAYISYEEQVIPFEEDRAYSIQSKWIATEFLVSVYIMKIQEK